MLRRLFLALVAAAGAPCYVAAQVHLTAGLHSVGAGRGAISPFTITLGTEHKASNFLDGRFFLTPFFYPIYDYEPAQVTILHQSSSERAVWEPAPREEPRSISPVLIERRGNRFIRMTDSEYNQVNGPRFSSAANENQRNRREETTGVWAPARRPTRLVFRDGHEEQTSNYAIVGGTLYKYPDYWIDDSSIKTIRIAELDIEATVRVNQARGVKFVLPQAWNEVVTRP